MAGKINELNGEKGMIAYLGTYQIVARTPKNSVIPILHRNLSNGESITEIPDQVRDDALGVGFWLKCYSKRQCWYAPPYRCWQL